jgi:hypothetical protein
MLFFFIMRHRFVSRWMVLYVDVDLLLSFSAEFAVIFSLLALFAFPFAFPLVLVVGDIVILSKGIRMIPRDISCGSKMMDLEQRCSLP